MSSKTLSRLSFAQVLIAVPTKPVSILKTEEYKTDNQREGWHSKSSILTLMNDFEELASAQDELERQQRPSSKPFTCYSLIRIAIIDHIEDRGPDCLRPRAVLLRLRLKVIWKVLLVLGLDGRQILASLLVCLVPCTRGDEHGSRPSCRAPVFRVDCVEAQICCPAVTRRGRSV